MDYPTMQEAFDAWIGMSASLRALMYDQMVLDEKFMPTIKKHGLTDEVFDAQADVAKKYGLEYVHPKYARGLKVVSAKPSPSVH